MKFIKKCLLLIVAIFTLLACLFGIVCCIEVGLNMDLQEGKALIFAFYLLITVGFGVASLICFKSVFQKEKVQHVQKEKITPVEENVTEEVNSFSDNVVYQETEISPVYQPQQKNYPKCNCDGCPKQDYCEYGHVIYDKIDKTKMSLFDKFMMVSSSMVSDVAIENFGAVATNEELHDKHLLLKHDKTVLYNTLNYLEEIKKEYIAFGKCGRSYFNFMKMGDEIALVKETLKDYDAYYAKVERIASIRPFILSKLDTDGNLLQKDLFAEYADIGKEQVSKVIEQLISDKIITKVRYGNTYMIHKV